jgi:hypothetical protein
VLTLFFIRVLVCVYVQFIWHYFKLVNLYISYKLISTQHWAEKTHEQQAKRIGEPSYSSARSLLQKEVHRLIALFVSLIKVGI